MIIGAASGLVCYLAVKHLKQILKYDDALDVFSLHGVGGIVGAVLVGVFATPSIGGAAGLLYGNSDQLVAQILSVIVTMAYSGVMTFAILMLIKPIMGLRVNPNVEYKGLDISLHGETVNEGGAVIEKSKGTKGTGIGQAV